MPRSQIDDAKELLAIFDGQCSKVSIMCNDNSKLSNGILQDDRICISAESQFIDALDIKPNATKVGHNIRMDVLISEECKVPQLQAAPAVM